MSTELELPLFPLHAVLFPEGNLALRIFEQRYLDMATACLKRQEPFGVCLIAEGDEVGHTATPHELGTLAQITAWDMAQLGVLQVTVQGSQRFRILDRQATGAGLLRGRVAVMPPEPVEKIPHHCARLIPLLRAVVEDLGERGPPAPHRFFDAGWVGYRWCEVLPIPLLARQKLLELEDNISRLEIIARYLEQRGLLR